MPSLAILVPALLVAMVAANGALNSLPQSITGPGLSVNARLLGVGIAGAEGETPASPPADMVLAAVSSAPAAQPPVEAAVMVVAEPVVDVPVVDVAEEAFVAVEPPGAALSAGLLASSSFRLDVPFRTQKDGDRFQGSNCGPAALGMVLDAFGIHQSNPELRHLSHTYQGTVGFRGGTALQHVARAGQDFGMETIGLYAGQDFRRWSIDDVREQLAQGRPVVPLVKYRLLPGHEGSTIRFDHYIVIYGMDGDRFLYHDPAYESPRDGAARWISSAQLRNAMHSSIVPGQAVAFGAGRLAALEATTV